MSHARRQSTTAGVNIVLTKGRIPEVTQVAATGVQGSHDRSGHTLRDEGSLYSDCNTAYIKRLNPGEWQWLITQSGRQLCVFL